MIKNDKDEYERKEQFMNEEYSSEKVKSTFDLPSWLRKDALFHTALLLTNYQRNKYIINGSFYVSSLKIQKHI